MSALSIPGPLLLPWTALQGHPGGYLWLMLGSPKKGTWPARLLSREAQCCPRAWVLSYHALGQHCCDLLDVVHGVDPQGDQGLCDILAYLGLQLPP